VFIPFTIGGGIRSVDDAQAVLDAGADKVAINSAPVARPALIGELSERFGAQCVVLAIDAKRNTSGDGWEVYVAGGRKATGIDLVEWAKAGVSLGAGEILLTSMDRDGTRDGYDIAMLDAVCTAVSVPVIASGGAGVLDDVADVLRGPSDAALLASLLHDGDTTVEELRKSLIAAGISVKP